MNIQRVDALLAYILIEAQKSDDFGERSLGPIHFIKYIYLADLSYAENHEGETFTGIQWRFHHFGPWDTALWQRIEPSLTASGAQAANFPSDFSDTGYTRWNINSIECLQDAAKNLSIDIQGFVSRAVRKFANSTSDILHFVYNTPPMLRAAPQEFLDFTPSGWVFEPTVFTKSKNITLTAKQEKKIKEWQSSASKILQAKIAEQIAKRKKNTMQPIAVYDSVYFEGIAALDADISPPLAEGNISVSIAEDVWKSKARYDP